MSAEMFFPIAVIVGSNVVYNICTKAVPNQIDPFAALLVTYSLGAVICGVILAVSHRGITPALFSGINWASVLLAFSVVFLEVGYIIAFRAGWNISACSIVANVALAIALFIIGIIFYKESVSLRQTVGMAICLVGLFVINMK